MNKISEYIYIGALLVLLWGIGALMLLGVIMEG